MSTSHNVPEISLSWYGQLVVGGPRWSTSMDHLETSYQSTNQLPPWDGFSNRWTITKNHVQNPWYHGMFWLCSFNRIQPHLHICFSGKRWPASVLQSFPASFVLFWMQCLLKQSDYWQCESFSVNVFVCLRGLPTLPLQPTLVRAYLADRQAPPTSHYPPVRSRGAQPVSHTTHLCSFMPWGFKAIKTMCFKFGKYWMRYWFVSIWSEALALPEAGGRWGM